MWKFKMLGKLLNATCYAVDSENTVTARVPRLSLWSCPNAILLAVIAVIVNSFNAHRWGGFSHICKERCKRIDPAVTNLYFSAAVAVILGIIGIGASLNHVGPNAVGSGLTKSVSSVQGTDAFDLGAPTRCRPTDAQVALFGDEFISARASTEASVFLLTARQEGWRGFSDDFYSSKSLSDDYSFDRHNDGRFIVVSSSMLTASTVNCCDSSLKTTNRQGIYG